MKKYLFVFLFSTLLLAACSNLENTTRDEKMDSKANQENLNDLRKDMDESDRQKLSQRLESLSLGETDFWQNSITMATYSVSPTQNFSSMTYSYCRYFRLVVTQAGHRQLIYGSACRQADGSWEIV